MKTRKFGKYELVETASFQWRYHLTWGRLIELETEEDNEELFYVYYYGSGEEFVFLGSTRSEEDIEKLIDVILRLSL